MKVFPRPHSAPRAVFELSVDCIDDRHSWLTASGELDLAAADYLSQFLEAHVGTGGRLVWLDVSDVSFLDCACLRVLLIAHHRFREVHGGLILTGVRGTVARLLTMTHLDQVLLVGSPEPQPGGPHLLAAGARTEAARTRTPKRHLQSVPRDRDSGPPAAPAEQSRRTSSST